MSLVAASIDDGIGALTLNRPDAGNALNPRLVADLASAVARVARASRVRAVLLRAQGPVFRVGGDLGFFADADAKVEHVLGDLADELHTTLHTLASLDAPLIGA